MQQPSGTVTFLFTDIEDATRLWEATPAEMAAAVQAHGAIVRSTIERRGGYVFDTGATASAPRSRLRWTQSRLPLSRSVSS